MTLRDVSYLFSRHTQVIFTIFWYISTIVFLFCCETNTFAPRFLNFIKIKNYYSNGKR
jgi:hypothetical protein